MPTVCAITGAVCVGKSTLARRLAAHLDWDLLSIDGQRGSWPALLARVVSLEGPAIVESVLMPAAYKVALIKHQASLLHVVCDESVRRERMELRGEARSTGRPLDHRWPRMRTVDTTNGISPALVTSLEEWLLTTPG